MDINWSVTFEITINGEEARFDELPEHIQRHITDQIYNDYYSGEYYESE